MHSVDGTYILPFFINQYYGKFWALSSVFNLGADGETDNDLMKLLLGDIVTFL